VTPTQHGSTQHGSASSRRDFIRGLSAVGLAASGCSSGPERPPNILFLLTDDQRADALGCAGNSIIQTPNVDRLAEQGVLFENSFVTTSICAVSRASFLTGQYARTHGIHGFGVSLTAEQHVASYPALVRAAGYRTGFIGKYGVGRELPEDQFDYFKGFTGQGRYFNEVDGRQVHLTEMMGGQALEFLEGCTDETPFCLSVSFKSPHVQDREAPYFLNDPAYDGLYEDITIPPAAKSGPAVHAALPAFLRDDYEGRIRWERRFGTEERYQESVKRYYRLIRVVDAQVGRIMEALRERGWDDNTVVIYTGDNGFFLGEWGWAGKWLMHEESIRTPLIIRDPRRPETRGTRRSQQALNIDIAPTIVEMAGIEPPVVMQGRSVVPLVEGQSPEWRTEWFYEHLFNHKTIPKTEGVRGERWKYTRYIETDPMFEELFDLEGDPREEVNLAGAGDVSDSLAAMRKRWRVWKDRLESWDGQSAWTDPA
jgi:arylsulfatase A-like enzyme